jgi:serine/threonine protein kinase
MTSEEKTVEELNALNQAEFVNEVTGYKLLSQYPGCNVYVVCLYDGLMWTIGNKMYYALALEKMDGDLKDITSGKRRDLAEKILSTPSLVLDMMQQLFRGLAYIHSKDLIVSDIKEDNLFYSLDPLGERMTIKYGDLGFLCRASPSKDVKRCALFGTPEYISQDYVDIEDVQDITDEMAKKNDIWALGVTLRFLLFVNHPIPGMEELIFGENRNQTTPIDIIDQIQMALESIPSDYEFATGETKNKIDTILNQTGALQYEDRPTALQVIELL